MEHFHVVKLKMKLIHERLREELKMCGLSQIEAARAAGLTDVQGIRDVLAGRKRLTVELLGALAPVGVDALYVVTGQRPRASQPGLDDRNRLIAAVEAVEEGLAEVRRKLPPKKRAELIIAAYDLITESEQSRSNVVNLVRIAA